LCDPPERFTQPKPAIAAALNNLLAKGVIIGVATGRGRSVQKGLRRVIDEKYWERMIVGNYNGSIILPLINDLPQFNGTPSESVRCANQLLKQDILLRDQANIEVRSKQISIITESILTRQSIFKRISETLSHLKNLKIVQSDHSIDILDPDVSKIHVVEALLAILQDEKSNVLIIGDQGHYGGNDFELLSMPLSISVDRISSSLTTCWNLSPVGLRGERAALSIIKAMEIKDETIQLDTDYLEKEEIR